MGSGAGVVLAVRMEVLTPPSAPEHHARHVVFVCDRRARRVDRAGAWPDSLGESSIGRGVRQVQAYDRRMAVPSVPARAATDVEQAMFEFVDAYNQAWEAAADEHELSAAQACVLGRVEARRSMGELAEELRCDASNITQIVARLEARELVHREPHPEHRRSRQTARTPRGDDLNAAFEESFEFPRSVTANPTVAERRQLTALLRKAMRA